jgi:hypothetical protein
LPVEQIEKRLAGSGLSVSVRRKKERHLEHGRSLFLFGSQVFENTKPALAATPRADSPSGFPHWRMSEPALVGTAPVDGAELNGPPPPAEQAVAAAAAPPPLLAALKPFGKGGVRLGWQVGASVLERGDSTWIEVLPVGSLDWQFHAVLEHGGRTAGVTIIKAMGAGGGEPRTHAWRLRSSGGESSEYVSLGASGGGGGGGSALKRGATAIFRGMGAAMTPPAAASSSSSSSSGSGKGLAALVGSAPRSAAGAARELPTGAASASTASARRPSKAQMRASAAESAEERNDQCRFLWQMVAQRQAEIEMVLRPEMSDAKSVIDARERVSKALAFDDALTAAAAAAERTKGHLFQALLEALREQGAEHAQMDNSSKNIFAGSMVAATTYKMSLAQWARLTYDASDLRNLVRVKVADDNDLRTARQGLELAAEFFDALSRLAALRSEDEFELLQACRLSA